MSAIELVGIDALTERQLAAVVKALELALENESWHVPASLRVSLKQAYEKLERALRFAR